MSFLKNLFGKSGKPRKPEATEAFFSEGDIFATQMEGKYHLFKLLRHEKAHGTYHVMVYHPLERLPTEAELDNLSILIYHAPIDQNGFTDPELLGHRPVQDRELGGYLTYLAQTGSDPEFSAAKASEFYSKAYQLSTDKQHQEAIYYYSLAIEAIPAFFEAIDNRAFCYMDMGNWKEAIAGFEQSLAVNPGSILAEFSIGECYLRLKKYPKAKAQFEKALALDPDHELSQKFLARTLALMGNK